MSAFPPTAIISNSITTAEPKLPNKEKAGGDDKEKEREKEKDKEKDKSKKKDKKRSNESSEMKEKNEESNAKRTKLDPPDEKNIQENKFVENSSFSSSTSSAFTVKRGRGSSRRGGAGASVSGRGGLLQADGTIKPKLTVAGLTHELGLVETRLEESEKREQELRIRLTELSKLKLLCGTKVNHCQ